MDQLDLFEEFDSAQPEAKSRPTITFFLAAPSSLSPAVVERVFAVVRSSCEVAASARGFDVEFLSGRDAPQDRKRVEVWMRQTFSTRVDALIALFGPSWGAGQQESIAVRLRVPRLVLAESRAALSGMSCPPDGDALGAC